jgi:hypothetical protein
MENNTENYTAPKALLEAQKLAHLSDTSIRIPIIGFELGLDFILGLIPVIGDTLMLVLSARVLWLGKKLGVPKALRLVMLKNCLVDYLLGLVPFVGDIFDMFYKANKKNVRIMEKWWVQENHKAIKQQAEQKLSQWDAQN